MAVFGSIALARAVAFWRACRRTLGAPDGEAPRSPGGRSSELTPDAELSLSDQTIARFVGGYISWCPVGLGYTVSSARPPALAASVRETERAHFVSAVASFARQCARRAAPVAHNLHLSMS